MYTICCEGKKLLQSIEGAISLKITRINAAKKVYTFNDLRDLESKLVLIRGRSTKGGAEIGQVFRCKYANNNQQIFCIIMSFTL